jgi:hypothetical protein
MWHPALAAAGALTSLGRQWPDFVMAITWTWDAQPPTQRLNLLAFPATQFNSSDVQH